MSSSEYHLQRQPIPAGFQIFEERLEVAGVSHRRDAAYAFAKSREPWLEMERDPGNAHDRNAIKVLGCSKGLFGTKRRFIGYVPRDTAKRIVEGGWFDRVRVRLLKTYAGDSGFVEIGFQILGPKGELANYLAER
jgi:hypothetical protein